MPTVKTKFSVLFKPTTTLALAIILSGCASLSTRSPELPAMNLPAAWSTSGGLGINSAAPGSLAQWWQRFNDPLLDALIERALQNNTSVQTAQAALQQARALRDVKTAGMLPGVSASASAQRSQTGSQDGSNNFRCHFRNLLSVFSLKTIFH